MSQNKVLEEYKPLKLTFCNLQNLYIIPSIGDGNCYFHSILRAFNTSYINAKTIFDRVNLTRTFRNALADRLQEIDPLTGKDYYSGLNNGRLEEFSQGVKEYSKDALRRELLGSDPVDNIYQELISNAINKDIYIIDSETKDMYNVGSAFSLYYKGRNSIILYYTPGHFEVIGVKRSDGSINTLFTPEHKLVEACRERLLSGIRLDRNKSSPIKNIKSAIATPRVTFEDTPGMQKAMTPKSIPSSPVRVTALRPASPKR